MLCTYRGRYTQAYIFLSIEHNPIVDIKWSWSTISWTLCLVLFPQVLLLSSCAIICDQAEMYPSYCCLACLCNQWKEIAHYCLGCCAIPSTHDFRHSESFYIMQPLTDLLIVLNVQCPHSLYC